MTADTVSARPLSEVEAGLLSPAELFDELDLLAGDDERLTAVVAQLRAWLGRRVDDDLPVHAHGVEVPRYRDWLGDLENIGDAIGALTYTEYALIKVNQRACRRREPEVSIDDGVVTEALSAVHDAVDGLQSVLIGAGVELVGPARRYQLQQEYEKVHEAYKARHAPINTVEGRAEFDAEWARSKRVRQYERVFGELRKALASNRVTIDEWEAWFGNLLDSTPVERRYDDATFDAAADWLQTYNRLA